ncbi:MAG: tyrosine-protein phosphatase [Clostridium sp.]|nr:tyrosine-protein phosphatase [Clostridium sp.]
MQRYHWENTFNARDLGYTPTTKGSYIKYQRFIRSDAPCKISDDIKDFLVAKNIKTVIDLRNENIVKINPNAFTDDTRFLTYNFPLSLNPKAPKSEEDVIENYFKMLENDKAIFHIFHTMADSEGGTLFHCQEGKDRTGVISALLLLLGDVADIDIIADYEISNAYLYEMTKAAKTIPNGIPGYLLYIKSEYMENILTYLRKTYGGIENYLLKKGVSQMEMIKLKNKLLE